MVQPELEPVFYKVVCHDKPKKRLGSVLRLKETSLSESTLMQSGFEKTIKKPFVWRKWEKLDVEWIFGDTKELFIFLRMVRFCGHVEECLHFIE